jgi:hypothetical protein
VPVGALVSIGIPGIGVRHARVTRADPPQYACAFLAWVSDAEIVAALSADTLVAGAFPQLPAPAAPSIDSIDLIEEPETPRLPLGTRIAAITALSVILWAAVIAVVVGALG